MKNIFAVRLGHVSPDGGAGARDDGRRRGVVVIVTHSRDHAVIDVSRSRGRLGNVLQQLDVLLALVPPEFGVPSLQRYDAI